MLWSFTDSLHILPTLVLLASELFFQKFRTSLRDDMFHLVWDGVPLLECCWFLAHIDVIVIVNRFSEEREQKSANKILRFRALHSFVLSLMASTRTFRRQILQEFASFCVDFFRVQAGRLIYSEVVSLLGSRRFPFHVDFVVIGIRISDGRKNKHKIITICSFDTGNTYRGRVRK